MGLKIFLFFLTLSLHSYTNVNIIYQIIIRLTRKTGIKYCEEITLVLDKDCDNENLCMYIAAMSNKVVSLLHCYICHITICMIQLTKFSLKFKNVSH